MAILALLALTFAGVLRGEFLFWKNEDFRSFRSPVAPLAALLTPLNDGHLPVVISDGQAYVELAYYAPPGLAKRIVGLVDPPNAVLYAKNDSVDRQMLDLACCFPLQLYQFSVFSKERSTFLLYSDGGPFDWWPARLRNDSYSLELVASQGNRNLYPVHRGLRSD